MKKIMKLFAILILMLSFGFSANGAEKKEKLYVGTNMPEFPPFEYLEGSEVVGFDIDFLPMP